MGKSKAKRFKKPSGNNPTGLPSVKDTEAFEAELAIEPSTAKATGQSVFGTILEELQSGNEDTRLRALMGLSCLGYVELDQNALRTIAPMLIDHSPAVQLAAANALRMFVLSGGATVADMMVEDDLMTILSAHLTKQSEEIFGGGKPKIKDTIRNEVFIASIRLLWSVCENSEVVLPHANNPSLLNILLAALQSSDRSLAIPAAQCLQTISEDNPQAVSFISKQQDYLINVIGEESFEPEFLHLQCLIAGLVVNIHYGLVSRVLPATTGMILSVLSRCLSQDIAQVLEASEESAQATGSEPMEEDGQKTKPLTAAQIASTLAKRVCHIIDAQICALEILANICSSDEDDEGMDTSEGSDEALSESEAWDEEYSESCQTLNIPPSLPVEVHEALLSNKLLDKAMSMSKTVSPDILFPLGTLAEEEGIQARLFKRQCRALLSFHNLVRGLTLEELGGPHQLGEVWKELATKIVTDWHKESELLEAATTSLRALTTRLAEEKCGEPLVASLTPVDLETFCGLVEKCKDSSVHVNVYRVLASLAAIVSDNFSAETSPLLMVAGRFLLDQSCRDVEVWVQAEALDALMDALSEDCSDQTCAELQLVQKLRALLPSLQHKIRASRRSLGANLVVVTTVKANLARFIKYKAQRLV